MDEVWERAVESALDGQTNYNSVRALTLDGAVKCFQGRLPHPRLLEKFQNLEHLSIANVGVSSLENFPRLPNLQKLVLSDNRIAGALEHLVEAGLDSLRDLDLSNNRIQYFEELVPLAQLKLVSLDLYECPVTRIKDYRSRVFGLIRSLKYLDKMDVDENERPESDEEEEEEEEEEEDDEEDDPGSGEIDGQERFGKVNDGRRNGDCDDMHNVDEDEESDADEEEIETARAPNGSNQDLHYTSNGILMAASVNGDDDEESDADEEEIETARVPNGSNQDSHFISNGYPMTALVNGDENVEDEDDDDDDDDDDDLGEEIDEEESEDDDDVVEVHEIEDSEEDGIEEADGNDNEDHDEEEVEDEEEEAELRSIAQLMSTEGDIYEHEQGEEDENGEIGEDEEQGIKEDRVCEVDDGEDDGEDEDDVEYGIGFLLQPIEQAEEEDAAGSDLDPGIEEEDDAVEVVKDADDQHGKVEVGPSSSHPKRKRDDDNETVVDAKSAKFH